MNHKYKSLECDLCEHVLRNGVSLCSTSNSMYLLKMAALSASQSAFFSLEVEGRWRFEREIIQFNKSRWVGKLRNTIHFGGIILCGEVYFVLLYDLHLILIVRSNRLFWRSRLNNVKLLILSWKFEKITYFPSKLLI